MEGADSVAKVHLSRLLDAVAAGEEIILAKGGRACAPLVPVGPVPPRRLGFPQMTIPSECDEPLPEDEGQRWES